MTGRGKIGKAMACFEPMPNDLMTILICNMGIDYKQAVAEYQKPGGPERLRHLAGEYVHNIKTNATEEGSPKGQQ